MATLSLQNINKIYDNNVQAVFDFNLEIKDKEFIVFVGPSGCGKSTTLRMVAGLEDITSGQLFIDGVLMNNVVPKDRNIAMVFQSYALYPHMTVYENMAFALKLRKIPMPIYEPNPEIDYIRNENKQIRAQIKKLNKVFKKKQDADDVLAERSALYKKLYENEENIKSLLVQVVGIDTYNIKRLEKEIKTLNADLAANEKKIESTKAKVEAAKAAGGAAADEKAKAKLEGKVASGEEIVEILTAANAQKRNQLADAEKNLEFLKANEVPLNKVRHLTKDEIDLEVNKAAESIDLLRYLFRKPAALSGGQRQRVALGRAIVRKPKVFLMDEPLSNLDAKLRVQTRSEISKIHERVGATTIYVTHDQTEAMTMADRIVVMKDGYIQQIGSPEEVYSDPANKFVGGFIGSPAMNFVEGVYSNGVFTMKDDSSSVEVKLNKKDVEILKDYEGKEVIMGVRPESIYLADDKNNESPTAPIELECDFAELLGYELVLYTYVAGQKIVLKTSAKNRIRTHDKISVSFNDKALYFFNKETEARIK